MANGLLALFYAAALWSAIMSQKSLVLRALGYSVRFLHGEELKISLSSRSAFHHFSGFMRYSRGSVVHSVCFSLRTLECRNLQRLSFGHEGEDLELHAICRVFFLTII